MSPEHILEIYHIRCNTCSNTILAHIYHQETSIIPLIIGYKCRVKRRLNSQDFKHIYSPSLLIQK